MGVKQVDCIKRTTQQVSVIMQNNNKKKKNVMFFQERFFSSQENHQPVPPCVWINSPLDQHSDIFPLDVTLTLPRSHVHIRGTNRTCQSGFRMPGGGAGGRVRSAPSSSCSLPG